MKNIYLSAIVVCVSIIAITSVNHQNKLGFLFNANIEALARVEGNYCYNGGEGASQCDIDAGITIAGYGVSAACSVTCKDGFYACCGIRCTCIKE